MFFWDGVEWKSTGEWLATEIKCQTNESYIRSLSDASEQKFKSIFDRHRHLAIFNAARSGRSSIT